MMKEMRTQGLGTRKAKVIHQARVMKMRTETATRPGDEDEEGDSSYGEGEGDGTIRFW